jgi:hypothetical protein
MVLQTNWARKALAVTLLVLGTIAACVPGPRSHTIEPGLEPMLAAADSARADSPAGPSLTFAILPLANYSATRDAADLVAPLLTAELARQPGIRLADQGAVQAALEAEPWLLLDRLPPDLVDRLGAGLHVKGLLVGAVLDYGYRDASGERVPQVSLALRLLECPGGRVVWSGVHSRDGEDGEWLFGFGRVRSLEQLASRTVQELLASFPAPGREARSPQRVQGRK